MLVRVILLYAQTLLQTRLRLLATPLNRKLPVWHRFNWEDLFQLTLCTTIFHGFQTLSVSQAHNSQPIKGKPNQSSRSPWDVQLKWSRFYFSTKVYPSCDFPACDCTSSLYWQQPPGNGLSLKAQINTQLQLPHWDTRSNWPELCLNTTPPLAIFHKHPLHSKLTDTTFTMHMPQ